MPTPTPKLGIPKPLGGELVTRAAFNAIWDQIDTAAASQAALDGHKAANPLDHPDGSVSDAKLGNRTIADGAAPTGDSGTLTTLLGWLASMVRSITGGATWRAAPAITLAAVKTRLDDDEVHRVMSY